MTIQDICTLSEEVRSGELMEAVFLDNVKKPDTQEADTRFVLSATYPTEPVRVLLETVSRKFSRRQAQGGFVLTGTLGSGKSHALLALYHIARGGVEAQRWLMDWNIHAEFPPDTRVAVVQMVAERPPSLWEPLFKQLDAADKIISQDWYPSRDDWLRLAREGAVLLVVDELERWVGQQPTGIPRERTCAALQNLLEAAKVRDVPLAAVISLYGLNPDLNGVLNRTQPGGRDMTTAVDREQILRHRLVPKVDRGKAEQVVDTYLKLYEDWRSELPRYGQTLGDWRNQMIAYYPFHPQFVHMIFQVYAAAPHHESVRGILFLFARLLRSSAGSRDLLLSGDVDLLDEDIAADLRKLDVGLVNHSVEDLQQRCLSIPYARETLATVLLRSVVPEGRGGATIEDILVGALRPGLDVNTFLDKADETLRAGWFLDEIDGRWTVTREIVLRKQIEQQARVLLQQVEGRDQAVERVKQMIRDALGGRNTFLLNEDPWPESSGAELRHLVSLEPLNEAQVSSLYQGRGNLMVLLAPKSGVSGNIAEGEEMLLGTARALVCEQMLKRGSKRQSDLKRYRKQFTDKLTEAVADAYAVWWRISRTNDLGEEPRHTIRPVECALDAEAVRSAVLQRNDVNVIKGGIARILRQAGAEAPPGRHQAGRTVADLRRTFREILGLPLLVEERQLSEALADMVADDSPDTGAVVAAGKPLYGYEHRDLPAVLDDDWRVWLRKFAPPPPAKGDIKRAVEQVLAEAHNEGCTVAQVAGEVGRRVTGQVEPPEIFRAVAEWVNDGQAVVEWEHRRHPEDGVLEPHALPDYARIWLSAFAPPDDRTAARRSQEFVEKSHPEGITVGEVKRLLGLENIPETAVSRALDRLRGEQRIAACRSDDRRFLITEGIPLTDAVLLKLPEIIGPPSPTPVRRRGNFDVGPYRLWSEFQRELRNRLHNEAEVLEIRFTLKPMGEQEDVLFGVVVGEDEVATVSLQHTLTYSFRHSLNKPALLKYVEELLAKLPESGGMVLTAHIESEVPQK